MNKKEILIKALEKARDNGSRIARQYLTRMAENPKSEWSSDVVFKVCCFDHDFAEKFWGKYLIIDGRKLLPAWKYHIQKMVLSKEPIMYLSKFVQ